MSQSGTMSESRRLDAEFTPQFFDDAQKVWRQNKVPDGQSFRYIFYGVCNEKKETLRRSPRLVEKSKKEKS